MESENAAPMMEEQSNPTESDFKTNSNFLDGGQDVNVTTILTQMPISYNEIPFLRGAIIKIAGASDELFHDHRGSGFRYSYPLIQYKIIDGNAAIIAVNDGIRVAKMILPFMNSRIQIGHRTSDFILEDITSSTTSVSVSSETHTYLASRWLPLNQDNYIIYNELDDMTQKINMLERLLIGNILSFAKGIGIFLNSTVYASIVDVKATRQFKYKNVMMLGFDIIFKTNVTLPSNIGLGKGVSLGFGTITE